MQKFMQHNKWNCETTDIERLDMEATAPLITLY